jgi:uncharacterized protein (DUF2336 family)
MIVRHFLQWVRTAGAAERADATSALARAYLHSDLSIDDRMAAEGAMIMLLDDPSPLVREALARALEASPDAPPAVIHALASDQPTIATIVLERSPLFVDADLVDQVGAGDEEVQTAIARRRDLTCPIAAAIAEVGGPVACLTLIENAEAEIAPVSLDRIVERFGHLAAIREALLQMPNLALPTRHALMVKLSQVLAGFVTSRQWLAPSRAERIAEDACEKATVALAAISASEEVRPLITHLRRSGQLTPALILRALLSGNQVLFEDALAELAEMPVARVSALIHDRRGAGFRAVFDRAGMPASTYPAFRAAIDTMHEIGFHADPGGSARLKRRMVERVLTSCEENVLGDVEPLLILLRRFATEAAREEARLFCNDLAEAEREELADNRQRVAA